MPLYDCGDQECSECERAFGPDRSKAIAYFHARKQAYARYWAIHDLAFDYHDRKTAFRQLIRSGIHWRSAALLIRDSERGAEHGE